MTFLVSERWLTEERVRIYPRIVLVLYVVVTGLWFGLGHNLIDPAGKPLGADFISFYAASELALEGHSADAYDPVRMFATEQTIVPANQLTFTWFYPPTYHLLVLPLALMPYIPALLLFVGITLGLYIAFLYAVFPHRRTVPIALAFSGTFVNAFGGQNGFISTVLLGVGLLGLEKRPVIAGVALGLLTYKPQLGILLPFVLAAGGYWRSFAAAALTAAAAAALAAAVLGADNWVRFWQELPIARAALEEGAFPWSKMVSVFAAARLVGVNATVAYFLHGMVALVVAILTVTAWRHPSPLRLRAALAAVAALLMSPFAYDYDAALLALPIALLAADGLEHGWVPGMRMVLVAAWLTPLFGTIIATPTHLQLMPVSLLALFALIYRRLTAPLPLASPAPSA